MKLNRKQEKKRLVKRKKPTVRISKDMRDIIHGYVMSDGYLTKNGCLQVQQGSKQKGFVYWLYKKLKPIQTSSGIRELSQVHSQTKKTSSSFRFYTKAVLKGFRQMWYKPTTGQTYYQKVLPQSIDCFFNETFIAVWFAGDGTKVIGSYGAKFEVTAFSVSDRLKLQQLFLKHYQIKTKIIQSGYSKKGTQQWALSIPSDQYPRFRQLITQCDLIPTLFPYKLHKKKG